MFKSVFLDALSEVLLCSNSVTVYKLIVEFRCEKPPLWEFQTKASKKISL